MKNIIQLENFSLLKLNFSKFFELTSRDRERITEAILELDAVKEDLIINNKVKISRTKKNDFLKIIVQLEVIDPENRTIYDIKVGSVFNYEEILEEELEYQINNIGLNIVAVKIDNVLTQLAAINGENILLNLQASDFINEDTVKIN